HVLSLSGKGEELKNILYAHIKDVGGEDSFNSLTNMITELAGTYEFFINKETYYIEKVKMDLDITMDMGFGEVKSTEQAQYEYSDFNEVEEIVVHEEVKDNSRLL